MFAALMWTGRAAAVLALVFCIFATAWAATFRVWLLAPVFAAGGLGAFLLAWRTDQRLRQDWRHRKEQQLRAWHGAGIAAPLRRIKWLAILGLLGSLAFLGYLAMRSRLGLPFGMVLFALFGLPFLVALLRGLAAIAAGQVVRLDPLGIHFFRGQAIPWRDVQALDLELVSSRGFRNYRFVVTLQPHAARAWPRRRLADWLAGPRLRRNAGQVFVTLAWAAIDPDLLLNAARVIAGRAGVPLGQGWSGFTDRELSAQMWDADLAAKRKNIEQWLARLGRDIDGGTPHGGHRERRPGGAHG